MNQNEPIKHSVEYPTSAKPILTIAEYVGCRIRKVDSNTGIISTVVGDGTPASTG